MAQHTPTFLRVRNPGAVSTLFSTPVNDPGGLITSTWTNFTATITAATAPTVPTLNNCKYIVIGDMVLAKYSLTWSSSLDAGVGAWKFSLPVPAVGRYIEGMGNARHLAYDTTMGGEGFNNTLAPSFIGIGTTLDHFTALAFSLVGGTDYALLSRDWRGAYLTSVAFPFHISFQVVYRKAGGGGGIIIPPPPPPGGGGTSGVHWGYSLTQDNYNLAGGFSTGAVAAISSVRNNMINSHIGGFGVYPPEYGSLGTFDWGGEIRGVPANGLDDGVQHVRDMVNPTNGHRMITFCTAPGFMKPSGLDFAMNEAPNDADEGNFAALCADVAARYPDVKYFQFWNEMKGMDNLTSSDRIKYVRMYNLAWTAVKAVRPDAFIGGPYVVFSSWETGLGGNPASEFSMPSLTFLGGVVDNRVLDVYKYFHDNALGYDFICVDIWAGNQHNTGSAVAPGLTAHDQIDKFPKVMQWIRQNIEPTKPIVCSEFYPQAAASDENAVGDWVIEIFQRTANTGLAGQGIWYLQWGESVEPPRPFNYDTGAQLPYIIPKLLLWETPPTGGGGGIGNRTLVYEETFTSSAGLGVDFYARNDMAGGDPPRGLEQQIWDPALVNITGGNMHLGAENRSGTWYGAEVNWIRTFNPGYTEVRYWQPTLKPGFWAGPWLLRNNPPVFRPEIDFGEDPALEAGVLGYLTAHVVGFDSASLNIPGTRGQYNTVGIEWGSASCSSWVNGVKVAEHTNPTILAQINVPLFLIIQANIGVPGFWGGQGGPDGSWTSTELIIDYVRHYE